MLMHGLVHRNFSDLLPTDADLHRRESEWVTFLEVRFLLLYQPLAPLLTLRYPLQRYENIGAPYENLDDSELDDVLDCLATDDNDAGNPEDDVEGGTTEEADEEDGADDYALFSEMLKEGRQAVRERKRLWEETGDSFILDHCSDKMRVHDWVKQNLNDSTTSNLDISTLYGDMCKKKKMQSTFLESIRYPAPSSQQHQQQKRALKRSLSVGPLSPASKRHGMELPRTPSTASRPPLPSKCLSESTHNRRFSGIVNPKRVKLFQPSLSSTSSSSSSKKENGYVEIQKTPSTSSRAQESSKCLSDSTHNRRSVGVVNPKPRHRGLLMNVRRLSTVPESPSNSSSMKSSSVQLKKVRSMSLGDYKMPRQRTMIYSPIQPLVEPRFKFVLKWESFDPTKTLIYEPPSDVDSPESDEDIMVTGKRALGGKIFEI